MVTAESFILQFQEAPPCSAGETRANCEPRTRTFTEVAREEQDQDVATLACATRTMTRVTREEPDQDVPNGAYRAFPEQWF